MQGQKNYWLCMTWSGLDHASVRKNQAMHDYVEIRSCKNWEKSIYA